LAGDGIGDGLGRPLTRWFGKNCLPANPITPDCVFAAPALGTLGNSGTRTVAAPGHFDFNMALVRSFRLKENQRVEFRWEVYNVTNSFRPMLAPPTQGTTVAPIQEITNGLFGQLKISDDPRIMQFALKYLF